MRLYWFSGLSVVLFVCAARDASAQAAYGAAAKEAAPPAPASPGAMTGDSAPAEKSTPKFNNEGTFKVSGSAGSGAVGGGKSGSKKPATTAAGKTTKVAAKTKGAGMTAQWPGFRMTDDGGSELMVEFSQNPTTPTEHKVAGSVTYVFKGNHAIKSNNQNPLITVHFNTPVASARLMPKKGELHLVIDYRAGAAATTMSGLRASSDGDGQQFFVKFPAGTWLPKGAENDEIEPAKTKLTNTPKDAKETGASASPPKETGGAKAGPNP